ncbi:MAG: hypothetical protein QG555_1029 [Thermodesulfobacteriota bacterium]|nr:hypothetical protein [Thermodesulfobacteriota bacterium]
MNKKSASALVWASVITGVVGMFVMSSAAGFVLYVVASILSVVPLGSGPRVLRIAAAVSIISLTFAYHGYPAFAKELAAYRKHAAIRSIKVPAQSTVESQGKR